MVRLECARRDLLLYANVYTFSSANHELGRLLPLASAQSRSIAAIVDVRTEGIACPATSNLSIEQETRIVLPGVADQAA